MLQMKQQASRTFCIQLVSNGGILDATIRAKILEPNRLVKTLGPFKRSVLTQ